MRSQTPSDLRQACLTQPRVDTHAHLAEKYATLSEQAATWDRFPTVWQLIDSRVTAEGCRILYGRDIGSFVRSDCDPAVLDQAAKLRERGPWAAVEHALDIAHIEKQLAFSGLRPKDSRPFVNEVGGKRLAYLAYIDSAINGRGEVPCPDHPGTDESHFARLETLFGPLGRLESYLDALDGEIDTWRSFGVVGMKTAIAYTSGLAISDPTTGEARAAFARKNDMTPDDVRILRDCAFRHALLACLRNGLPVVIHTGYQIWGHSNLAQSNPMHLHNLLIDPGYRGLTFVLLHGGNPYVGETTYLAGMFGNVIVDFTWIGWMTPARFRFALGEWLATVPHDRMCWGSDTTTPESIVGVDSIVRRLIAEVLDEAVRDRTVDERYALEFVENAYQATPKRVFGIA